MTINDIKITTLQLMFANYADDLREQNVDELTNEEYTKYTVNMDAAINRALARIEAARVLPLKSVALTAANGTVGGYLTRWALTTLASDFVAVSRVIHEGNGYYDSSIPYELEGDTIVLPNLDSGESYRVLYYRRPSRVTIAGASSATIDVPDRIAEIIPYWVKADLYEEDEPSAAVAARNIFEQMLADFTPPDSNGQGGVKDIYGGAV